MTSTEDKCKNVFFASAEAKQQPFQSHSRKFQLGSLSRHSMTFYYFFNHKWYCPNSDSSRHFFSHTTKGLTRVPETTSKLDTQNYRNSTVLFSLKIQCWHIETHHREQPNSSLTFPYSRQQEQNAGLVKELSRPGHRRCRNDAFLGTSFKTNYPALAFAGGLSPTWMRLRQFRGRKRSSPGRLRSGGRNRNTLRSFSLR